LWKNKIVENEIWILGIIHKISGDPLLITMEVLEKGAFLKYAIRGIQKQKSGNSLNLL